MKRDVNYETFIIEDQYVISKITMFRNALGLTRFRSALRGTWSNENEKVCVYRYQQKGTNFKVSRKKGLMREC